MSTSRAGIERISRGGFGCCSAGMRAEHGYRHHNEPSKHKHRTRTRFFLTASNAFVEPLRACVSVTERRTCDGGA